MIGRELYACNNEAIKHKHKTTNQTLQEELKMKKIIKKTESKKGLSLVEVICVIAIICILAGAILFNYIHIFRNAIDALGGI